MRAGWRLAMVLILALLASSTALEGAQEDKRSRKGRNSASEQEKSGSQWFADPVRGWIRSDERDRKRDRDKDEPRKEDRGRNKRNR